MSLERVRARIQAGQEHSESDPPESCVNCPNLKTSEKYGRVALSCLLERADSQMTGPRDLLAQGGATAVWVDRAIFGELLDDRAQKDRGAVEFRERLDAANDACPIIEKIIEQLPKADDSDLIDLTPPSPLLPYGDLRVFLRLDPPRPKE